MGELGERLVEGGGGYLACFRMPFSLSRTCSDFAVSGVGRTFSDMVAFVCLRLSSKRHF
jgi:hypothetical protein